MFLQDTQQKDNSDNQKKRKKKEISQWQGFGAGCHCWTPSMGGFQTGLEEAQSNLIQPSKQRCFEQDTGPADLKRSLKIFPQFHYTPNAK